jgi:glycosyltransferase involved in cell wall biosynthesis
MVWRSADRVLPVTGVLRDELVQAGVDPARISVVPNGVVLDRYLPRDPLSTDPQAPLVLGFVGFVRSWHGLDAVVTAIADQAGAGVGDRKLCLTVIGDGPARAELEQQARRLGVSEQVRFTGVVEHAEVPAMLRGFDIALQPKVVAYASPLKIFDYMAAGCAIVAPDQPNIREILEHERTALLFNPNDSAALWQAISRLIDDPALRQRLAVAARAELEAKDYTWHGNARRIAQWAAGQMAKP